MISNVLMLHKQAKEPTTQISPHGLASVCLVCSSVAAVVGHFDIRALQHTGHGCF